ncbi:Rdx family protein [Pseudochrobactrum asaccharolyticum]|nr:Rdx family protein [Pseudochrobactrum asaccharolyticum]
MIMKPRITIEYCIQCNWMLRAAWAAQELLQAFGDEVGEIALIPGGDGNYIIRLNDQIVWDRKTENGFPETDALVARIREAMKG